MTTVEPTLLGTPPPFRRDLMVQTWLVMKALSDAGDAIWTIAVAWTAVQIASPAIAGLVVAAGTVPRALILLVGGAIADRVDARRMMLLFNGIRVVVLVGTAAWILMDEPTVAVLLGTHWPGLVSTNLYSTAAPSGRSTVAIQVSPSLQLMCGALPSSQLPSWGASPTSSTCCPKSTCAAGAGAVGVRCRQRNAQQRAASSQQAHAAERQRVGVVLGVQV